MKKTLTSITALSICSCMAFNANASNAAGNHYVFNLVGTGYMYESFEDLDGDGVFDDPAICFDVDLINAQNQQTVGTATDCLSNVTPAGTGLALTGTTYFRLPSGTLVTRGNTTVQPVLQETTTPSGQAVTHITGASGTGNAVVNGTGQFAGATGTSRLSGMVNLADFSGAPGDPISFDCVFVVDLD